ncbi:DUF3108 domain-containing protein [Massilia sp. IC2-278]|uniref:DUF3108 domain-containing protein n=1 Tax=Massilia sp. IC2-278 TaxID=2887200 RepID=UPI001E4760D0|nr:DUF3108 domain-containing protein [Massilia sp. IC2-278]MCC2961213.1 DUF3108 domain-containing protein [Massilia sp. IC2-278]
MRSNLFKCSALAGLLALGVSTAMAAPAAPVKRAVELPPSADLAYDLNAQQKSIGLKGDALITWRAGEGKYDVNVEAKVQLLGKLNEYRSQGAVDAYGLAPDTFTEKRYRKDATTTTFVRDENVISFSGAKLPYVMKGGEQDRASVTWQLASVARAAGEAKFKPGSEWTFIVAGRRDAEPWTFKVIKQEKIRTGMGELDTIHVKREPRDSRGDSVEVWLAPGQEWYPVKIRFEDERDTIDQTVKSITRK